MERLKLLSLAIAVLLCGVLLLGVGLRPANAAPARVPAAQGCFNYTVQAGDWVWQIARTYGDSPYALIARNGLDSAGTIHPGQVLVVCSSGSGTGSGTGSGVGSMRVVYAGGVNIRAQPNLYAAINGVAPYGSIMQVLQGPQIDPYGMRWYNVVPPWTTPGWAAEYSQNGTQLLAPYSSGGVGTCLARPTWYQVRYGDTLYRIAQRYCTTVASIQQANGITNVNYIVAGQWLWIP